LLRAAKLCSASFPQHHRHFFDLLRLTFTPNTPLSEPSRLWRTSGDGSQFHATFGIYAQGIGPETVVAPLGWQERLIRVEVAAVTRSDGTAVGWTLEIHDLILAKLAAGRPHDIDFVRDALDAELIDVHR
jgi:Nucleotidyltransferase of unknown function (DUF6036)